MVTNERMSSKTVSGNIKIYPISDQVLFNVWIDKITTMGSVAV